MSKITSDDVRKVSALARLALPEDKIATYTDQLERILAYGLSRDVDFHDEELVDELVDHFEGSNYSVPELIEEIVSRETFSKR